MKYPIAILSLVILMSFQQASVLTTDLQKSNLTGKVQEIKHTVFMAEEKYGEIVQSYRPVIIYADYFKNFREKENPTISFVKTFNDSGNIVEHKTYRQGGGILSKYLFIYNDKGILTEKSIWLGIGNGELGNEELREPPSTVMFKYDDHGNRTEENHLGSKHIYKYDATGRLIEEISYDYDGKLKYKFIWKYNTKGQKSEMTEWGSDGINTLANIFKYDSKGNQIEWYEYDVKSKSELSGRVSRPSDKYDDKGNLLSPNQKYTYKYDEKGNMVEWGRSLYNSWEDIYSELEHHSYKYDYDANGNWVKRIEFKNDVKKEKSDEPLYITIREIKYFP